MKPRARTPGPETLHALLDRVESGAAVLDAEGRVLYANPCLRLWLKRPLVGRPLTSCLRGRDRELAEELLKKRRGELEVSVSTAGGPLPLLLRAERSDAATLLLVQDLRPRRKHENTILAGRVTRSILNEISEAVVFVTPQGTVLRASASAWKLAGRNPIGRSFDDVYPLRIFERRKSSSGYAANLQTALTMPGGFRCQAILPLADGGVRHLTVSSKSLPSGNGTGGGAVVLMSDVGEARTREIELRRANESLRRGIEERTARLLQLYDLARMSNEAESVEQALSLALERLCRNGEWSFGQAFLRGDPPRRTLEFQSAWPPEEVDAKGLVARLDPARRPFDGSDPLALTLESGRLEWTNRLESKLGARGRAAVKAGFHSMAAVPIRRGPEVLGALELFSTRARPLEEDARGILVAAGLQVGEVIDRKRLQKEFAEAVSQEHETIGRELHDSVGQELTGLALMMRAMPEAPKKREEAAEEITQGLQRVLREVHDLSRGVFPAELRNLGLAGGITRLAQQTVKRAGFRVFFEDSAGPLPLDAQTCLQVFRVAQEAVNNAVKYSGGTQVHIRLSRREDMVELDIQDDGRGLPARRGGLTGSGLRIMRFRAEAIGGALRFRRSPSGGARITCRWKLTGGADAGASPQR